jgi:hypothetical protein
VDAEPVIIGAHRRAEAVVISYDAYLELARDRLTGFLTRPRDPDTVLDADAAMELANRELAAMRRERNAGKRAT